MYRVELTGFLLCQFGLLQCHDTKARFNDLIQYGACMTILHGIRLNHCKCSVSHYSYFSNLAAKIGRTNGLPAYPGVSNNKCYSNLNMLLFNISNLTACLKPRP